MGEHLAAHLPVIGRRRMWLAPIAAAACCHGMAEGPVMPDMIFIDPNMTD